MHNQEIYRESSVAESIGSIMDSRYDKRREHTVDKIGKEPNIL